MLDELLVRSPNPPGAMSLSEMPSKAPLLVALVLVIGGCSPRQELPAADPGLPAACAPGALTPAQVIRDLPYASVPGVESSLLSLDVHAPPLTPGCRVPVVVWVHGGAWAIGDKANGMSEKVPWMLGLGYVFVSVNYRLSPEAPTAPPDANRVQHPTHVRDVAAALSWVMREAHTYGGDTSRVAVLGHSAGAHLVALVATDARFLEAQGTSVERIACVGSLDTEAYDIPRALRGAGATQRSILENAFGTDPAVHQEASPMTHVASARALPPFLLARRGDVERRAITDAFSARLREAGVPVTTVDASGYSHEQVNSTLGVAGERVMTPAVEQFLSGSCFGR